jgi:hypothetical protein
MFPGVIAHPRVVPRGGAVISGAFVPGGVRPLSSGYSLPLLPRLRIPLGNSLLTCSLALPHRRS